MRLVALVLMSFCLSAFIGQSSAQKEADKEKRAGEITREIDALRSKIAELETELARLKPDRIAWDTKELEKYFTITKPIKWDDESKAYSALLKTKRKGILAGYSFPGFAVTFGFKATFYDGDEVKIHEAAPGDAGIIIYTDPLKWEKDEPIRFRVAPNKRV